MAHPCQHVIVIDDDPDYSELVRIALTDYVGTSVVQEFCSGATALDALSEPGAEQPDALIIDLHMPMVSGIDVVTALRGRNCSARIVMLSSALTTADHTRCIGAGADKVYAKPMSLTALGGALRDALY